MAVLSDRKDAGGQSGYAIFGGVGQGEGVESGVLLAGVFDGEYLYSLRGHAIDEDIVGRDEGFACAGHAARAIHIGMVG